ncbi:FAD-binding and (Fe-S)-binding domain-containing protein [Robertkochia sediminum]|uniref:FAD-binding and (Fe-S)-binding domain-containing protein n=1 Tax=Robertkochia sediminum TaxID=2785326 RepID=UPI001933508A|nr:FAD-binding and (Fe-S)-binding domain-containing protein [Robertkochia sediminum]MBL7473501.1 FAD-binding oxidoreductase [Robertkochia sediminum]
MKEILHQKAIKDTFSGEFYTDDLHRMLYATDASVYREIPQAVAYPKTVEDLKTLVAYAQEQGTSLIPRAAGTSLAGQCVGNGVVVDLSRYFDRILEFLPEERKIKVQPGIIRDELNAEIASSGLFFGPNTSTSNRCMIGGMTANNSSGSTSIKYGVTRDKVLEVDMVLSDGSEVTFGALSPTAYAAKLAQDDKEGEIYRFFDRELRDPEVRKRIAEGYPKADIHRRNTGYAIDMICGMKPFDPNGETFNLAKLISGSEGTLGLITSITLQLDLQPPKQRTMIAAHFNSIHDTCKAVKPLMEHDLYACEMMDKVILDCTKNNKSQAPNRFFIKDDPKAILLLELCSDNESDLEAQKVRLLDTLYHATNAYACPELKGAEINKALELRKAGLGLLGNIVGDKKAVACIEDTAVSIDDLSDYIDEFEALMASYGQEAVYYAHAGAGELHLRPILNLKKREGVKQFRAITTEVAHLVKKYRGAMSGEHGEGRVRSEFITMFIGTDNYQLLRGVKRAFDPLNLFNPGKIVDPVAMDTHLRYETDRKEPVIDTFMDFSDSQGLLKAVEKCNGSGDCRKTERSNGAMCPSYHATREEKNTTRARANALREVLSDKEKTDRFNSKDLKEVLDLCLSCKACASECPSNIDMAAYKAEFLHQYQKANGRNLRDKLFAYSGVLNKWAAHAPLLINNKITAGLITRFGGIAPQRRLPEIKKCNLERYRLNELKGRETVQKLILYIDEFSEYLDSNVAKDAISLLIALGYEPVLLFGDSGRTFISKGFLPEAKKCIDNLLDTLEKLGEPELPVVGIEPSAILGFRDDFLRMASDKNLVQSIAKRAFTLEEFFAGESRKGAIKAEMFTTEKRTVKYHAHCHQKALSDIRSTFDMLNIPQNYTVSMINSGCCGMAGSFGYEKEHYEVSMKIGEQRLFPAIRKSGPEVIIAANGNSCRHQIYDGTKRTAKHPVSVLREALKV